MLFSRRMLEVQDIDIGNFGVKSNYVNRCIGLATIGSRILPVLNKKSKINRSNSDYFFAGRITRKRQLPVKLNVDDEELLYKPYRINFFYRLRSKRNEYFFYLWPNAITSLISRSLGKFSFYDYYKGIVSFNENRCNRRIRTSGIEFKNFRAVKSYLSKTSTMFRLNNLIVKPQLETSVQLMLKNTGEDFSIFNELQTYSFLLLHEEIYEEFFEGTLSDVFLEDESDDESFNLDDFGDFFCSLRDGRSYIDIIRNYDNLSFSDCSDEDMFFYIWEIDDYDSNTTIVTASIYTVTD